MSKSRTDPGSRKTAVVIPYYQEEVGILRGAVESALSQEGVSDLEIIVVDDGSPAPARDDLQGLDLPAHVTLKLIEQPNRGPGAARNRALDGVRPDTAYVAFLDSDDRWTPNHLRSAQSVLGDGYDVYFCDAWSIEDATTRFGGSGMDVERHPCIDAVRRLHRFVDDPRRDLINGRNWFWTSTVAYRFDRLGHLRFPEVAFMGEDLSFWMGLAAASDAMAFSRKIGCISGPGVHIYGRSGWGTPKCVWRHWQYMKWRKWLRKSGGLSCAEAADNLRHIKAIRRGIVVALLHEIRTLEAFHNRDIIRFIREDPAVLLDLMPVTLDVLRQKIVRRR